MSVDTLLGSTASVERGTELRHRPSGSTVIMTDVTYEANLFDGAQETWTTCRFTDGRVHGFQWPDEFGSVLTSPTNSPAVPAFFAV